MLPVCVYSYTLEMDGRFYYQEPYSIYFSAFYIHRLFTDLAGQPNSTMTRVKFTLPASGAVLHYAPMQTKHNVYA